MFTVGCTSQHHLVALWRHHPLPMWNYREIRPEGRRPGPGWKTLRQARSGLAPSGPQAASGAQGQRGGLGKKPKSQ